jgi:protein-disulfide isomerase
VNEFDPNPDAPEADAPTDAPAAAEPTGDPATPEARGESVRRQNRLALLGTVALIIVLAVAGGIAIGRSTGAGGSGTGAVATPAAGASAASGASPAASSQVAALPSQGNRLGLSSAKVVIDYWADFQCPYCAKFARDVIPQLSAKIADGTVALVHRDYAFIGPESVAAAVAVQCAGREGKYWPMHDAVYAAQKGENQGAFARERLLAIGTSVGLDAAKLTACLDDRAALVAVLDDTAAAVRAGVKSTPTIDVNGTRFLGVPDVAKLMAAVDAAAAGASPAPLPTPDASSNPWSGTRTNGREAGDPAAPVTVELWTDYQSQASGAVAQTLEPELRKRISQGKVHLVLRDLALLGDESVAAASTIRCTAAQAGPAMFVHDVLSTAGQGAGAGIFVTDNLLRLASQLGLDVKAFDACLADPATAAAVRDETAKGKSLGLSAGPTVVVSAGGREAARFSGTLDTVKVLAAVDAAR